MSSNMLKSFLTAVILLVVSSFSIASGPEKYESFTLKDYNGKEHSLSDYKDSKAVVIIFVSTQCPVSNAYNERMEQLNKSYSEKGVTFLGINSNKAENSAEIRSHAKKNGLNFTILKDEKNTIADKFEASFTPEVYVLNNNYELLYHGRIDDSQRENNIKNKDLENALNEILNGKPVSNPKTKAFGCTIKRV